MAMHLNDRMFETHLSTPISQTFALIAGDCNTTAFLRRLKSRIFLSAIDSQRLGISYYM
jgi:hypothetical protein